MQGRVESVDQARDRIRIIIMIFGRPVPVELEESQLELVE
jgi:transcription antitermination factor NusG